MSKLVKAPNHNWILFVLFRTSDKKMIFLLQFIVCFCKRLFYILLETSLSMIYSSNNQFNLCNGYYLEFKQTAGKDPFIYVKNFKM